jgi:hypothetical protein
VNDGTEHNCLNLEGITYGFIYGFQPMQLKNGGIPREYSVTLKIMCHLPALLCTFEGFSI